MWKYFVSLLLIIEGIQDTFQYNTYRCKEGNKCNNVWNRPQLPQTNEELRKMCTPAIESLECQVRFMEGCVPNAADGLELVKQLLSIANDICSEDTLLHAAVVDNLKCFSKVIEEDSGFCVGRYEDRVEQFTEALRQEGIISLTDNENDTSSLYECIALMNIFACQSLQLEKDCGTVAMEAYIEIMQKIGPGMFLVVCDDSYVLLPALIRLQRLEENIEESFRKRK